eukprot:2231952-Pyramimonas_sp.AAC.1
MAAELVDPFSDCEICTDCSGILGCVWDRAKSCSSQNSRAHLWSFVWHVFEGGLKARKVKGHATMADVLNGVRSDLDRLGNKHADRFARLGAGMHPMPEMMVQAIDTCRS